jgi:transcriptional regulator with XRE-family HTH domain
LIKLENLLNVRILKNMTQQDLAEASGVTQAQVSLYETGKATPTMDTSKKLAKALDTTIDNLMGDA